MFRLFFTTALAAILLAAASADEVVMDNGDRLTGTVLRLEGGKLVVETDYAGEVSLDASRVKSVTTQKEVTVHLAGGEVLKGKLVVNAEGKVAVDRGEADGAVAINWAGLEAINPPGRKWTGSVTLGAFQQSGNTDRASFSAAAEAERETETDRFGLRFLANYAEEDDEKTARNTFGAAKYDYFFRPRIYGYLSEEMYSDDFRDLTLRSATGAGLGWRAVERDELQLEIEAGAAYIVEDFEAAEDEDYAAARGAVRLDWRVFSGVKISDRLTVLPSLESDRWQLRNEAALTSALGAGWSLKLSNIVEHDSQPSEAADVEIEKTDVTWILGLQYEF